MQKLDSTKRKMLYGVRMALVLLACILIGFLLIMGTYMLPQEAIHANLLESVKVFDDSDWSPKERMDQTLVEGYPSTWLDNTSDIVMLQHAAYTGDESIVEMALLNPSYESDDSPTLPLIQYLNEGSENMEQNNFSRYWNGYLVALKPLLMFMSYQDIRVVNMIVQAGLMMLVFALMYQRGIQRYLPAWGAAVLTLTPLVLPLNMHYSVVWIIALVCMILILSCGEWIEKKIGLPMLFMLTGSATSFFDLLSNPLLSFGLPAVTWLLMNDRNERKNPFSMLIQIGLSWLVGYVGMWAGKWALVAIGISGEEAMIALSSIGYRSSADEVGRLETIMRNVTVVWRKPMKLLALGVAAYTCMLLIRRMIRGKRLFSAVPPMMLLSLGALMCLPFAWYFAIPNFNHIHYFFAHRTLSIAVFAAGCILTKLLDSQERQQSEK